MNFKALSIFCLIFSAASLAVFSQDYSVSQWDPVDIELSAKKLPKQPFAVEIGAILRHEDGTSMRVPGFYNDNSEYVIRVGLPKMGQWLYRTFSTLPELSGREGKITVSEATPDQHGPIVINDQNPQRFSYADGTPYFLMAFELDWLFALDYGNESGIPKTEEIIDHVASNGFNQVVMNVYAYDANWGEKEKMQPQHDYRQPAYSIYGGTNEKPDYSTLNINFFKHLDRVIAHLDDQQIAAHLMIYVWNKKVSWPEPESKEDDLYFDYVVKRYQAYPNLIWDISKEALAYGRDDMGYITRRIERLRRLDGHGRLLSVHDYNYCSAFPGKVDFISIQEWMPGLHSAMSEVVKKHSRQPVFNIEHGGYEKTTYSIFDGAYTDPLTCLDRNYQCVFAGTYSTYYWQNTSWYNVIYDFTELPKKNQPYFHYYKNLSKLFSEYDFNRLEPFQEAFAPPGLTDGEKLFMYYLSDDRKGIYGGEPRLSGKRINVTWFDPLTGDFYDVGNYDFGEGIWLWMDRDSRITGELAVAILTVIEEEKDE